ncbi:integral membrane protein DUF92-domain-containing protein [Crassisporium funariophilum]|nr:integral membrane protein DUF92-domain-containing protein [Crassisporium funariophilum]
MSVSLEIMLQGERKTFLSQVLQVAVSNNKLELMVVPLLLATFLSGYGLQTKSLSPSGACTALIVGFLTMSGEVRVFGVALIGLYLVGSRATKCLIDGKKRKALLEDGYHDAGYRSGWQVLCNSVSGLVAAFLWNAAFAPTSIQRAITNWISLDITKSLLQLENRVIYNSSSNDWCPLSETPARGWSRALVFACLGHFACCLGDTLASELGILSTSRPRLITTFSKVPPGTNGAMSVGGTVASVIGGGIMGTLVAISLIVENLKCSEGWRGILIESIGWGMFAGGFGSLVDSFLGATVQQTRYATKTKLILQDSSKGDGGDVKVISGWNLLTNNQVNLVSSALCAVVVGWMSGV